MVRRIKSEQRELLSQNELLSRLEPAEMEEFLGIAVLEQFEANDAIFHKGDSGNSFYAILEGRVGISTVSDEGKAIFLNILDPGEVFGEIALLDGKERTAGAVAMQPSLLLRVGRAEFLPFLERHPSLAIRLMAVLCARLRWISDIIEDTIFLDIPRRLTKRLLTLAQRHGEQGEGGLRIRIKLSQEELGHMLGATRESVNKGLRALQEMEAISYDDGYILIRDLGRLKNLMNNGPVS